MKHVIAGTAGHIDHGKTELVRALTGVDCDRLEEEKARGITIDIGFAPLALGDDIAIGFIDVPGHERFVKNMLAGATGIDVVILVVAADESIKPQTREHFDICRLLGVQRGIVAITKADLADPEMQQLVALEVRDFVAGSFLEGAPVIPVSAKTGEGISALKEALRGAAQAVQGRSVSAFFRLPVDRAFSVKGFGTVTTGTLVAGSVADGDEVAIYPEGLRAKVRGIQVHGKAVARAEAGQRTAVNLQGLETAAVGRGHVLAPPGLMRPSSLIDVELQVLPGSGNPLEDLSRVRYHQGTSELLARVKLLGAEEIEPGGRAFAQLRLETSGLSLPGDRFVVRRYSPMQTIGGGVVLDAHPEKHRGETRHIAEALAELCSGGPGALLLHALASAAGGMSSNDLVVRTGRTAAEVARMASDLAASGKIHAAGDRAGTFIHHAWFEKHRRRTLALLEEFHRTNPLMMGLPREELRERTIPGGHTETARFIIDSLAAEGKIRLEKEFASAAEHRVTLGPEEERILGIVEGRFREGGLNPIPLDEIVEVLNLDASTTHRIYHLLLARGRLVRIKEGTVFHAEAIERLKEALWGLRETRPVIDVAAFKEMTGTSRKNAIPLLEHLDAEKVTRRRGNDREILPPSSR